MYAACHVVVAPMLMQNGADNGFGFYVVQVAKGYCVNASALYIASRKNAFEVPPTGSPEGRVCLQEYVSARQLSSLSLPFLTVIRLLVAGSRVYSARMF